MPPRPVGSTQERFNALASMTPLSLAQTGKTLTIEEIRGGRRLKARLRDLGLNPGAQVRVVKNDLPGPLIIAVKADSRLALGRGMAHHILVSDTFN